MPETRSAHSKRNASIPTGHSPPSDEVILISSDDQPHSPAVVLRKPKMGIRALKKKLEAKEPARSPITRSSSQAQVLAEQRNKSTFAAGTKAAEEEIRRLKNELHRATADENRYRMALEREKDARALDSIHLGETRKRLRVLEKEKRDLEVENRRLSKRPVNGREILESLEEHIQCDICQDNLWEPYTIVECGHTGCRGCLIDWFNTTLAQSSAQGPHAPNYACPKCRGRVYQNPVQDFALKSVVVAVANALNPNTLPPSPCHRKTSWHKFFD